MAGRRRGWIVLLLVLAIATVIGHRLLRLRRAPQPNVLWITMDSLRPDHLGCSGCGRAQTPNIDAPAHQGALFTQCISQSNYTHISVLSMITGKYPFFLGARMIPTDLDSSHLTLAEALTAQGYFACALAEPWPAGFFQGLKEWNKISHLTIQKTHRCPEAVEGLVGHPFFIWLCYWDPHAPYTPRWTS